MSDRNVAVAGTAEQAELSDQPTQGEQALESVDLGAGVMLNATTLGSFSNGGKKYVIRIVRPGGAVIKKQVDPSRTGYEKFKTYMKWVARRAVA